MCKMVPTKSSQVGDGSYPRVQRLADRDQAVAFLWLEGDLLYSFDWHLEGAAHPTQKQSKSLSVSCKHHQA